MSDVSSDVVNAVQRQLDKDSQIQTRRWCFTINNPQVDETYNDQFWMTHPDIIKYLIVQEEKGHEEGTVHWQGFVIFNRSQRLSRLKKLNKRAHWEVTRGTNEEAAAYCRKEDTFTGGFRFEIGELPGAKAGGHKERLEEAANTLEALKECYEPPKKINPLVLMQPGFMAAYNALTTDVLGPYRPELKIITLIGPPGSGKSYAIQHFFPQHGRCIAGNSGVWFQSPLEEVMVFEEFCGQIQLQKMLQLLDPYPLALEVKGGMRPALYKTVVITSNTRPDKWYKSDTPPGVVKSIFDEPTKRDDAVMALFDRIGFSNGSYVPVRKCGHYFEAPQGYNIDQLRCFFWNALQEVVGFDPTLQDGDTEDEEEVDLSQVVHELSASQ